MVDAAGEPREQVGYPHLPAIFRLKRTARPLDRTGFGHDARTGLPPPAADPPPRSRGGDARPRGMAQPLDLARLLRRERVQPSVGRREPDGRSDLGPAAAECREAHVAMPLELELAVSVTARPSPVLIRPVPER